ncbi:DUF664 domain-containing protein [Cellulomonas sp. DKR-3]|uniref:DUF664 domain-containing protein n=1 Tax=Cellulomonas fulva TaxID=2835530 RepID=A0ABS5TX49_9CELL|nr:DUF664 domain-containing protein [Cellulomonas fulva]MBT0993728.1 DUF664 domain-containing protein [Cellulomonas fulva]
MISTDRTDPPLTGDEVATLLGFLDFLRSTVLRKADGLDADQLDTALPPSTMTLGGLLHHLALVEDDWCSVVLHGNPPAEPWASVDWAADRDWEWTAARTTPPEELRRRYVDAIARSDALVEQVLRERGLDAVAARRQRHTDQEISLRWILVHLIEEYGRHAGHADLIRERIDGSTGE